MRQFTILSGATAVLLGAACGANAQILNEQYAFNIDGTIWDSLVDFTAPPVAGFTPASGLGAMTYNVTGGGAHYFSFLVDNELGPLFDDETGLKVGAFGGTWEIDEPGYTVGDLNSHFYTQSLDNVNESTAPDDVALAFGDSFFLNTGDTATIAFSVTDVRPSSGPYLEQDNDVLDTSAPTSLFLTRTLDIQRAQHGVPDGGTTLSALAMAMSALAGFKYRFARRS